MRIGIDAIPLDEAGAGISRYVREILIGMMANSPGDDFVLYSWQPIHVPVASGNWRTRVRRSGRCSAPGSWLRDTLPRMVAEDDIDVFWGQNTVLPLRLLRPCRRVLTVHDVSGFVLPHTMKLAGRLSWNLDFRAAINASDAIIAVSNATARLLCRLLGVPRDRVTVIYEGCSSRLTASKAPEVDRAVAARFGLPGEFVLAVGTLEPRKDYATLLEAIGRRDRFPRLAIAGAVGWKSRGILRLVHEAERDGRALYLGRVSDDELAVLYRSARVMVYPSLYEGFGLPVLEAMACGCPVLCSWSSSMPEVGGRAACYFRPHDAIDLADKLSGLLRDERRLSEMRVQGIEQAARFSFSDAARQILDLLHSTTQAY
jgi:glycosyltransferase involved in cell wall biosynthesis